MGHPHNFTTIQQVQAVLARKSARNKGPTDQPFRIVKQVDFPSIRVFIPYAAERPHF